MPWMAPGEPRIPRMVVMMLGMVVFLHLLFMLRDGHRDWRDSRAYLVTPDGHTHPAGHSDEIDPHDTQGQSILSFIPTPPSAADAAAVPALPAQPFPRKIWQTGREGAASLDDESAATIATWTKLNQDWRYEILTDASAETYVRGTFAQRPEIVTTYLSLRDPILRADMLRYLILLSDGGVYSDMDTRALKPIDDWIPMQHRGHVNVVVGIEYDSMGVGRWMDWTLDLQFTNWAMLAQPGHPLMELTVQKVIYALNVLAAKKGQTISEIRPDYHEVLDTTGPAVFSLAIFEWLTASTGYEFSWTNCTRLQDPMLVNDVLILPVTSFGNSQPHSDSGPAEHQNALVQHMFRGSWKDDHPMSIEGDGEENSEENNEGNSEDNGGDQSRDGYINEHGSNTYGSEGETNTHETAAGAAPTSHLTAAGLPDEGAHRDLGTAHVEGDEQPLEDSILQ